MGCERRRLPESAMRGARVRLEPPSGADADSNASVQEEAAAATSIRSARPPPPPPPSPPLRSLQHADNSRLRTEETVRKSSHSRHVFPKKSPLKE